MRTALTIGYEHGSGKAVLVRDSATPFSDQRAGLKALQSATHPMFQRIEVWSSDRGLVKRKEFERGEIAAPEPPAPTQEQPEVAQPEPLATFRGSKPKKRNFAQTDSSTT